MNKLISFIILIFSGIYTTRAASTYSTSHSETGSCISKTNSFHEASYYDGGTEIIKLIMDAVGLEASFEIKRAYVPNAAAVVYQGKRYILYNPSFIAAMNRAAGTHWASIAVIAHEIGHHLYGHTLDGKGSIPALELEADEFSGFALRKMGATLSESQLAMRIIADGRETHTHPGRSHRLLAIAQGWNQADAELHNRDMAGKRVTPKPEVMEEPLLAEKSITFDVHFVFDPQTRYYITARNSLVKIFDNQLQVVGKLLATGESSYPLAFRTAEEDLLLINNSGKILNKEGKILGYITPRE